MEKTTRERRRTDDSLIVERGKTDDSFETYKDKAESETDSDVKQNRLEADEARLQRRSEADIIRESGKSEAGNKQNQKSEERNLTEERKSEDGAIEKERAKNDRALEHERGEKGRLLTQLVSLEREATDKNLLGERKKNDLEAELSAKLLTVEQTAHLETKSALTTREEFLAIVSHDLRNPIGAVLSSSELLLEETSIKGLGGEVKGLIQLIQRNAETAIHLIGDLLDMERIVEGKLQLQLASHSLGDLIRETVASYEHVAAEKKISLSVSPKANPSLLVYCDKNRIAQVLSNLLGNALKFTSSEGQVLVSVDETESDLKVSISDTGLGIPDAQKSRIFEKFAQLGNKDRLGLGLGLYISKTIIESHLGKLWVLSSPGRGSTFCFTLPKQ